MAWARARVAIWQRRFPLAAALLSILVLGAILTVADWYMARDERLGTLDFPISCGWRSQREFTRATALLHLFQFADAEDSYRSIIEHDPDCAIAYWGIAMSRLRNPLYALPNSSDVGVARRALQSAAAAARTATSRERAYVAAVAKLFDGNVGDDWVAPQRAYARAMGELIADYPQDSEAKIFYALALNAIGAPGRRLGEDRARAAELLLRVFAAQPDHPGIDHYLTYCLGHAGYQPRPFEKGSPAMTPVQRISLIVFGFIALCGLGAFVTFTADLRSGPAGAGGIGGPFVLTASDGAPVTDRSFRGRWLLIYFGYTRCRNICQTTLLTISQALDQLGPLAAKAQPLFVTIDPERDKPQTVGEFVKAFDPRIFGLTGRPADVAALARQYRVFVKKIPGETADEYRIEHSSYVYVIGPDGRHVTLFADAEARAPEDMASRLRELLAPAPQSNDDKLFTTIDTRTPAHSRYRGA